VFVEDSNLLLTEMKDRTSIVGAKARLAMPARGWSLVASVV
jgi:hypothetical protein